MKLLIRIDKYIVAYKLLNSNKEHELKKIVLDHFHSNIDVLHYFLVTTDFLNIKNKIKNFRKEIPCSLTCFISGHDIPLQNKMWKKYRYTYMFLQLCIKHHWNVCSTIDNIIKIMKFTIEHPLFVNILNDTNNFKKEITTE